MISPTCEIIIATALSVITAFAMGAFIASVLIGKSKKQAHADDEKHTQAHSGQPAGTENRNKNNGSNPDDKDAVNA